MIENHNNPANWNRSIEEKLATNHFDETYAIVLHRSSLAQKMFWMQSNVTNQTQTQRNWEESLARLNAMNGVSW